MKNIFNARPPPFDAKAIQDTIQRALASAGLDTSTGLLHNATETVRRALASPGLADAPDRRPPPAGAAAAAAPGSFGTHTFSNHAGARAYKLYVPARSTATPPPLLVMLHGCTQSADDFAAGTRMNRLADAHGFLVVYPEQASQANPSRCWNWFMAQDQLRDAGEPALLAGLVRDVAARHGADPHRIYVAGLSAGAAMAVILGETHPDLFAGVGAHSGLPYASAHDIPSAMAAMKGGGSRRAGLRNLPGAAAVPRRTVTQAVPTIVFHGDRDHTVQQTNGIEIVEQAEQAHRAQAPTAALRSSTLEGTAPGGRRYSRSVHADATGLAHIECWTLHGAGHAWSGGSAEGSYTDATGPDASAEMVRFFLALPPAGTD